MKKKDFISLADYSRRELETLVKRALELKGGASPEAGKNKVLAMIFRKPSTRTNVSFFMAMKRLGGDALYLGNEALQLSRGETIEDTARVISGYVDAIMIRTFEHSDVLAMAGSAGVPVINGLTDYLHPCQALGDVMSLKEAKGGDLRKIKLAYVGDGNNVCNSLISAAGIFGFSFSAAVPEGYEPSSEIIEKARAENKNIELTDNPSDAVKEADAVYTDVWVSMGDESERRSRKNVFRKYRVDSSLISGARADAVVMHCLPAHRGEEITDEVMNSGQSYIFQQAENRMYIQQAIMEYLFKENK